MNDHEARTKLESLVSQAVILARHWVNQRNNLILDEKSAGQLASNADTEVEAKLRRDLTHAFPGESIIGEELGGTLDTSQSGWVIDPIDGTSNFILGLPMWGISVGLLRNGKSVLGAVALPAMDLVLSASVGSGLHANGRKKVLSPPPPQIRLLALGENDHESGAQTDTRAQCLRDEGYTVVRYRSAVFSLSMAALGRLGGYVEHGCGLWDIAAADVICREAGLAVTTAKIAEGRYSVDARWR